MSFQRSKKATLEKLRWAAFCEGNKAIIESTGLPLEYVLDEEYFIDFLMHGYIDHHRDVIRFTDGMMTPNQRKSFPNLLRAYFSAGYQDPGTVFLTNIERAQLEKDFASSFS